MIANAVTTAPVSAVATAHAVGNVARACPAITNAATITNAAAITNTTAIAYAAAIANSTTITNAAAIAEVRLLPLSGVGLTIGERIASSRAAVLVSKISV